MSPVIGEKLALMQDDDAKIDRNDEPRIDESAEIRLPEGDKAQVRPDDATIVPPGELGELPGGIQEFAHYKLIKELGRGAQGVVFLAEDKRLRRKVALKMLASAAAQSRSTRERFQREAEAASKLDHPGICGIHEMGEEQGIPYIAMQYVRGTALSDMVESAKSSQTLDATVCDISRCATNSGTQGRSG